MNEATTLKNFARGVTEQDKGRCVQAPGSAGLQYAQGAIEKLQWMCKNAPAGILASNVSSHLRSCADSIADEVEYLKIEGIQ